MIQRPPPAHPPASYFAHTILTMKRLSDYLTTYLYPTSSDDWQTPIYPSGTSGRRTRPKPGSRIRGPPRTSASPSQEGANRSNNEDQTLSDSLIPEHLQSERPADLHYNDLTQIAQHLLASTSKDVGSKETISRLQALEDSLNHASDLGSHPNTKRLIARTKALRTSLQQDDGVSAVFEEVRLRTLGDDLQRHADTTMDSIIAVSLAQLSDLATAEYPTGLTDGMMYLASLYIARYGQESQKLFTLGNELKCLSQQKESSLGQDVASRIAVWTQSELAAYRSV
jgi:hypothetical protein